MGAIGVLAEFTRDGRRSFDSSRFTVTRAVNGLLRVAYWACGNGGEIEVVGELKGIDVKSYKFPGPHRMGEKTLLKPALEDYIAYLKTQVAEGAKQGCAVIITDGILSDAEAVKTYRRQIAQEITAGRLPRTNFVLVGTVFFTWRIPQPWSRG